MLDKPRQAQEVWSKCKKTRRTSASWPRSIRWIRTASAGGAIPPIPQHSGNETVEKEAFSLEKMSLRPDRSSDAGRDALGHFEMRGSHEASGGSAR